MAVGSTFVDFREIPLHFSVPLGVNGSDTMRKWLLAAAIAGNLQAAVIRGTVVDNQTSRPLARVVITAEPVTGTRGQSVSTRTNSSGSFELPTLAAGAYLLTANKRAF